ncbi:MAG: glycosyltransferase family 4 protein [Opitutales bacterium]|nr:glycosyltransferase family 4 protein [Opitutales bacterium]
MVKTIYFWQNIPSPHQVPYQRELAEMGYRVVLVVDLEMLPNRTKMGWEVPSLGKIELRVNLSWAEKQQILDKEDLGDINLVSGVRGCRDGGRITDYCIAQGLYVGWIVESWDNRGWRGFLRWWRYRIEALRYRNRLSRILVMGDKGVSAYRSVGYSDSLVKRFGYVVDAPNVQVSDKRFYAQHKKAVEIVYVGSLYHGKGIDLLFDALSRLQDKEWVLRIIGEEREPGRYREIAKNLGIADRLLWEGVQNKIRVYDALMAADLLVLPSRYDGWGAVVNEALLCGTPVVCSDAAGASCVLSEELGDVFPSEDLDSLKSLLAARILRGPISKELRERIRANADLRISARAMADLLCKSALPSNR